jgi:hypothetical protein
MTEHKMASPAEYAFGLSIVIVFLTCYVLSILPPREPPKVKARRVSSPSPLPPEIPPIIEPYSEEAIVSSMTALYNILIDLGVINSDDVVCPPPGGHSINIKLCDTLHLNPRVVSLMKRLPYPTTLQTSLNFDLLEDTRAPNYTIDSEIEDGRDPDGVGTRDDKRLAYLAPTDIALTIGGLYGTLLVLDTRESLCISFPLVPL